MRLIIALIFSFIPTVAIGQVIYLDCEVTETIHGFGQPDEVENRIYNIDIDTKKETAKIDGWMHAALKANAPDPNEKLAISEKLVQFGDPRVKEAMQFWIDRQNLKLKGSRPWPGTIMTMDGTCKVVKKERQ